MGLPDGASFIILTSTVFVWYTRVTDGETDRQTDGRAIAYTRYSIHVYAHAVARKKYWKEIDNRLTTLLPRWPISRHCLIC